MSETLDGDEIDPIAICGFSFKFPQDATSSEAFWRIMVERRCTMAEFPTSRLNIDAFHGATKRLNTFSNRGGHFIQEDLSLFDAGFFGIPPTEAAEMDPMQRWLLETTFRAIENAGIPMESISGTNTGVYTGCFTNDYLIQLSRDAECMPTYMATGIGTSMLANRISWFFNLQGPSVAMDSACSSSATALDVACQALKSGSCEMGVVAGCNLTYSPEYFKMMSNMNFLSPDSRCYSFDHRANGYARGEGISVIILKKLSDAIKDGNCIRSIIRATGCNEDGRTPSITQPSSQAQERLIRETYRKAGLSMRYTRFFEAHGTGTSMGDPIEAHAIGQSFKDFRSLSDPLFVGAVKSNIGHLEGASALAGVIKAVLVLEKGVIPPNTNFEKLNPKIDATAMNLKFPDKCYDWPSSGLRRASINSFGYGGGNSHIVLDDAYHYMLRRGIEGRHYTTAFPGGRPHERGLSSQELGHDAWTSDPTRQYIHSLKNEIEGEILSKYDVTHLVRDVNGQTRNSDNTVTGRRQQWGKLLVFSAADRNGIERVSEAYQQYFAKISSAVTDEKSLGDLAFTLDSHRSHLSWRSFAIPQSSAHLNNSQSLLSPPTRISSVEPKIALVFTGQGAQWAGMGRELMVYAVFRERLRQAGTYLTRLGCAWDVTEELLKEQKYSRLDDPQYSQTLCTVLQIAIVDLLRSVGVHPHRVIGHSSGEIAAAYAGYHISAESAWKLSYLRGVCSAEIAGKSHENALGVRGAMMAVSLSEQDVHPFITKLNDEKKAFGISIACINSPKNVTIAGEDHLVDKLEILLEGMKVFCRKLHVLVAYHSRQMMPVAAVYERLIGDLTEPVHLPSNHNPVPMISSVTGQHISRKRLLRASYWAANLSAPVKFFHAISSLRGETDQLENVDLRRNSGHLVDHLLEIGPAAALQGPLREILNSDLSRDSSSYSSILRRGESAHRSFLQAMGELHCRGARLDLRRINEPTGPPSFGRKLLVDLPDYPFDHSRGYWCESRRSRNYRFRSRPMSHFLGVRCDDWTRSEPSWRHFLRSSEMAWTADHVINGRVLYPAAGMLVMAIEAIQDLHDGDEQPLINAFELRDVDIGAAISLNDNGNGTEIRTALRPMIEPVQGGRCCYAFTIRSYNDRSNEWTLNCRGTISAERSELLDDWTREKAEEARIYLSGRFFGLPSHQRGIPVNSQIMYKSLKEQGFEFGPVFQLAQNQLYNEDRRISTAEVELLRPAEQSQVLIHPASLDTFFHLALTTLTSGGSQSIPTAVPTHIGRLWLSKEALECTKGVRVNAGAAVDQVTRRGSTCSGIAVDSTDVSKGVVAWYEDLRMTNVTSNLLVERAREDVEQFCMRIQCKPALNHMTPDDVAVMLEKEYPSPPVDHDFWRDIELLCDMAIDDLADSVEAEVPEHQSWKPWRRHYWNWVQHRVAGRSPTRRFYCCDSKSDGVLAFRAELESRLETRNKTGKLFVTVASKLVDLFHEVASPLEILMQSGILREFYEQTNEHSTTSQIAHYVDLLAHQQPGLKLLEIGGGTGGGTRNFVRGLGSRAAGEHSASLRCARYDFTDVSPTLVSAAKLDFGKYQPQMTFSTLDIERSYIEQGFPEGEYDVVLAVNVLHITSNLQEALRRARRSLKTGGKLIFKESLSKEGWVEGFVFGLFPGWWFGVDDGRSLSPSLDLESWNTLLRETGFSECEMVLKFLEDTPSPGGWMVATATDATPLLKRAEPPVRYQVRIIIDGESELQVKIAKGLTNALQSSSGVPEEILSIQAMNTAPPPQSTETADQPRITILLAAYEQHHLRQLDELAWGRLRAAIMSCRNQLWISSGGGRGPLPDHGFLDGLARTLRHEQPDRQVVLLGWDESDCMENKLNQAVKVVREMESRVPGAHYEQDYIATSNLLHTRRLVEASDLTASIKEIALPSSTRTIPSDGKISFKMLHEFSELGHTLQYEQLAPSSTPLRAGEIEILVRALALQPWRDESTLETTGVSHSWGNCAGEILRAASDTEFHTGDRVFAAFPGQPCSHLVIAARWAIQLPDYMSFSDACLVIPFKMNAFHTSLQIKRAQPGDQVLVHNGASPAGHSVLEALIDLGCTDIWSTAANLQESQVLESVCKLPPDRIIPSAWLEGDSMLLSRWRSQFDLILISGSPEEAQHMVVSLIRPGGRIVIVRSYSDKSKGGLTSSSHALPPNTSLSVVDPDRLIPSRAALSYAAGKLPTAAAGHVAMNGKALPASALANARADEPVVVTFEDSVTVPVRMAKGTQACNGDMNTALHPRATYVVAGGLGGLGRVTARWLARHGAHYLILLSRSGPIRENAKKLLKELGEMGVCVEAPSCDISNEVSLTSTLAECSARLPPIRGCIQASMVLKESFLDETSFQDWEAAIAPKVRGSWNLHQCLPQRLDFFVLLSSSMGIIGTKKLAGYNAGNTYQAALARYRRTLGQAAVCVDLGGVLDEGYVAEKESEKGFFQRNKHLIPISMDHFHALLGTYCLQPGTDRALAEIDPEMIIGLSPPAYWSHKVGMVPFTMGQPFWGHMHHLPPQSPDGVAVDVTSVTASGHRKRLLHKAQRLVGVEDCPLERAADAVSETLGEQVSRLLCMGDKPLEHDMPLQQIGIDSLSAIDMRDWVRRAFDVEIPVFEILDGSSLREIGMSVVSKARTPGGGGR